MNALNDELNKLAELNELTKPFGMNAPKKPNELTDGVAATVVVFICVCCFVFCFLLYVVALFWLCCFALL